VLSSIDMLMRTHRARFRGRTTPVQFFWGTFDLALTRYSGRPADPPPGGIIERLGGDAEEIAAGWWPGNEHIPYPAFYAYAHPAPGGIDRVPVQPDAAAWNSGAGEFLLPYEAARVAADPPQAILEFLGSTYEGAAGLLGWDRTLTQMPRVPQRAGQRA
jgi:hypothetical protein